MSDQLRMSERLPIVAIVGPTASGKTHRAVSVAKAINAEIISGDSRQVYRGMDLGTGKDLDEYGTVPYHLIDIRPAGYKYNLHEYLQDFDKAEADIRARGRNIVLCGGTGMYVEAALGGLHLPQVPEDSELRARLQGKSLAELKQILSAMKVLHNDTDTDTCARAIRAIEIQQYYIDHPQEAAEADRHRSTPRDAVIVMVDIPRQERRDRISARLRQRLEDGMIEEVRALLQSGIAAADLEYYGLEYKYLTQHITGRLTEQQMVEGLETAIHQFAKRQMTWFRGMQRRGYTLHSLPWDMDEAEFVERVQQLLLSAPFAS